MQVIRGMMADNATTCECQTCSTVYFGELRAIGVFVRRLWSTQNPREAVGEEKVCKDLWR